jgi:Tfp pilus assembly protein PilW
MLMTPTSNVTRGALDERGTTLIEMLVAILTGLVVIGALFAILEVSLTQTVRIDDVTQANQLGRGAMTRIVDELHSACLGQGFAPVSEKSTERVLRFTTAYSESAVVPSSAAAEHEIVWSQSGQALTDFTYPASSGEGTAFVFPATPSPVKGTLVGEHITQSEPEPSTKTPVFQYYKYGTAAASTAESGESTLVKITPTAGSETAELGATAKSVAAVVVTFKAGPTETRVWHGRVPAEFSTQTTFAFSAPVSETTVSDSPCH